MSKMVRMSDMTSKMLDLLASELEQTKQEIFEKAVLGLAQNYFLEKTKPKFKKLISEWSSL